MVARALALPVAALAAACAAPAPRQRFAELTFQHLGRIRLDAGALEVRSTYRPTLAPPNVEHLFPVLPETTLKRWAEDRLAVGGAPGRRAVFTVREARVVETRLARTQGLASVFTRDQTERYDITLSATLEIIGETPELGRGNAVAMATRARTVAEGVTVNERDQAWYALLEAAMADFNAEMERQMRANLGLFLK